MTPRLSRTLPLFGLLATLALGATSVASAQEPAPHRTGRPVHAMFGVAGEGGGFVDQASGLMGGVGVHAGIHLFGLEVYGLSQGFLGGLTVGPHSGAMQGILWSSAMLGFGVGPFHLAAGPSLDFAWGCEDDQNGASCYHGTPLYGADARLALQFGHCEVSANVHPTFYGRSTVTGITLGLGFAL